MAERQLLSGGRYQRQRALASELNARFPKIKSNLGQQMFRSAYYNGRMADESHAEARGGATEAVRRFVANFSPIELDLP